MVKLEVLKTNFIKGYSIEFKLTLNRYHNKSKFLKKCEKWEKK